MEAMKAGCMKKLKECSICQDIAEKITNLVPEEYRDEFKVLKFIFFKNIFKNFLY